MERSQDAILIVF